MTIRKFTCRNLDTGKCLSPFIGTKEQFDAWLENLCGKGELLGERHDVIEEDDEQTIRDALAKTDDDLLDGLMDWVILLRMLKSKLSEIDEGPIKDILSRVVDLPAKLDQVIARQGATRRKLGGGNNDDS